MGVRCGGDGDEAWWWWDEVRWLWGWRMVVMGWNAVGIIVTTAYATDFITLLDCSITTMVKVIVTRTYATHFITLLDWRFYYIVGLVYHKPGTTNRALTSVAVGRDGSQIRCMAAWCIHLRSLRWVFVWKRIWGYVFICLWETGYFSCILGFLHICCDWHACYRSVYTLVLWLLYAPRWHAIAVNSVRKWTCVDNTRIFSKLGLESWLEDILGRQCALGMEGRIAFVRIAFAFWDCEHVCTREA